jgi:SAM-dependent methyltransferase
LETDTRGISCCFDEESAKMLDDYRKRGLSSTGRTILSALKAKGITGSTILEVGCGFGALTLELLKNGASSGVGIDLSPKMLQAAEALAAETGLSNSVSFHLADGAKEQLSPSEVVILDSVICCYPEMTALVNNTSGTSTRLYVVAIPDDRRPLTRLLKVFLPLQKVLLRRGGFRFFVHPAGSIIRTVEGREFRLVFDSPAGHIWSVLIFEAPTAA